MVGLFFVFGCDNVLENATTTTIHGENDVYSGGVSAQDPIVWDLATDMEMKPGVGKAKNSSYSPANDKDHTWIPVEITDRGLILQLLLAGGGSFSGTIENKENNEVLFGIYLSDTENLEDPRVSASLIATLTIGALETIDLKLPENFDQAPADILAAISTFLSAHPDLTTLIVYFTADGFPLIDLYFPTMSIVYPPSTRITNSVVPGDLADYRKTVKEVTEANFAGKLTNNGEAAISFKAYISLVTGSFTTGNPPAEDLVAEKTLAVGETVRFEDAPTEILVSGGANKLKQGIQELIDGNTLESNLFFRSMDPTKPIVAQMDSFKIESAASVSL